MGLKETVTGWFTSAKEKTDPIVTKAKDTAAPYAKKAKDAASAGYEAAKHGWTGDEDGEAGAAASEEPAAEEE